MKTSVHIYFFEDEVSNNFYPLTLTRHTSHLRVGIDTIAEQWIFMFKKHGYTLLSCNYTTQKNDVRKTILTHKNTNKNDQPCIWLNSRYTPQNSFFEHLNTMKNGDCLMHHHSLIMGIGMLPTKDSWQNTPSHFKKKTIQLDVERHNYIEHLWDLFVYVGQQIKKQWQLKTNTHNENNNIISQNAIIENRKYMICEKNVRIEAGSILLASPEQPIYLAENVTIESGAIIKGPIAIGRHSTIKMGAKLHGNISIGSWCKVGGEVHNTIFDSYSNKAHEGFLGHSIIGQWCNIGADTNVSNLKNDYTNVKCYHWYHKQFEDTPLLFLGTIMGDHVKTAINTQLNTGTVIGPCVNMVPYGFPKKYIPAFHWILKDKIIKANIDNTINTIQTVMARRNITPTSAYINMIKMLYNQL